MTILLDNDTKFRIISIELEDKIGVSDGCISHITFSPGYHTTWNSGAAHHSATPTAPTTIALHGVDEFFKTPMDRTSMEYKFAQWMSGSAKNTIPYNNVRAGHVCIWDLKYYKCTVYRPVVDEVDEYNQPINVILPPGYEEKEKRKMEYQKVMDALLQPTAPDEEEVLDEEANIYDDGEDEDEYYEDDEYEEDEDEEEDEGEDEVAIPERETIGAAYQERLLSIQHGIAEDIIPTLRTHTYTIHQRIAVMNRIDRMRVAFNELSGLIVSGERVD